MAISSCRKRVTDLFHEARLIAHVWYYHKVKREKFTKTQARQVVLTSEQYLLVRLGSLTPLHLYHRRVVIRTACGIKRGRQL